MTGLLSGLITTGVEIRVVPTSAGWGEVDSATDLAFYAREIAAGRMTLVT